MWWIILLFVVCCIILLFSIVALVISVRSAMKINKVVSSIKDMENSLLVKSQTNTYIR